MADKYKLDVNFYLPRYNVRGKTLKGLQPGGTLEADIELTAYEEVKIRGIWLVIGWGEKGRGTPSEHRLVEEMIYHGSLFPRDRFDHHVNFRIPENANVTYCGNYVTVEWFIRIRLDVPFWFDKRENFPFMVLPRMYRSLDDINMSGLNKIYTHLGPRQGDMF